VKLTRSRADDAIVATRINLQIHAEIPRVPIVFFHSTEIMI